MASRVLVLNGPNLGRLGVREPDVYGALSLDDLARSVARWSDELGLDAEVRQTDSEAELVRWLHEAVDTCADVVVNPAALTHYSYAVRDACAMVTKGGLRLVEVHISNPYAREEFRHSSVVGAVATGTVAGFGFDSYRLALTALARPDRQRRRRSASSARTVATTCSRRCVTSCHVKWSTCQPSLTSAFVRSESR